MIYLNYLLKGISSFLRPKPTSSEMIYPLIQGGKVEWSRYNMSNYVEEGLNLNSLMFSALFYKYRAMLQVQVRPAQGDIDNPERITNDQHPLYKLALMPNDFQSFPEFVGLLLIYLNLTGNAFIWIERDKKGNPTGMFPIRPDRIHLIPKDGQIIGYLFVPDGMKKEEGIPLLLNDVAHVKFPNPADPYEGRGWGLSPLGPMSRAIDVDNALSHYLKAFIDRGAVPGGLLKFNVPLDPTKVKEIKSRWNEMYGGVDNWTEVGVLDNGGEYVSLSQSFADMGFESLDSRNETRILGPFGVPPILAGARVGLEHGTYSNYEEARRAFWEDTLSSEILLFFYEFYQYVRTPDGAFLTFDMSKTPAMKRDITKLVNAAAVLAERGMPLAVALRTVGITAEEFDGGDVGYISTSVMPVERMLAEPKPAPQPESADTTDPKDPEDPEDPEDPKDPKDPGDPPPTEEPKALVVKSGALEYKELIRKSIDSIGERYDKLGTTIAVKALISQRRAIGVIMGKHPLPESKLRIESYFDTVDALDDWADIISVLDSVAYDVVNYLKQTYRRPTDIAGVLRLPGFNDYKLNFARPINAITSKNISAVLQHGLDNGWSVSRTSHAVELVFKSWTVDEAITDAELSKIPGLSLNYRAERIVRTETLRVSNLISSLTYQGWGVKKKEWVATLDSRTRDAHSNANGQVRGITEPFSINGALLMQPGDATLGAPRDQFINCRCTIVPVFD